MASHNVFYIIYNATYYMYTMCMYIINIIYLKFYI